MQAYQIKLGCGTQITLTDLEATGISYVPCAQIDQKDQPLFPYKHLWGQKKQVTLAAYGKKANPWTLAKMNGIQIMTGTPTHRPSTVSPDRYEYLLDIDIENALLQKHPDITHKIINIYRDACNTAPCIVRTKSDGRRLSAFAPYLDTKREFRDTDKKMLMEIFSIKGLSRLDNRYTIIEGSVLHIPTIPKTALQQIHHTITEIATEKQHTPAHPTVVEKNQIGTLNIHWDTDGRSQYFPAAHCQATSHQDSERATVRFQKSRGGIQGHCFNCAQTWWEIEPTQKSRTAHIRLTKQTDPHIETEQLQTLQKLNTDTVTQWEQHTQNTNRQHLLILGAGAGTGKTTAARNLKKHADISPTLQLADEKYNNALKKGIRAMRHRSRLYNRHAAQNHTPETVPIGLTANQGEVPCAYPDICNALAEKGYSPVKVFCQTCPRFDECLSKGYLSQWDLMPKHDAIYFSVKDDFFSDPKYRPYIDTIIKNNKKEYILVLDEVDPANLPPKRTYRTEHLKQIALDFQHFDTGTFLSQLIQQTATATTPIAWATALKNVINKYIPEELEHIDKELQGIPVQVKFQKTHNNQYDLQGKTLYTTLAHIHYRDMIRTCAVLHKDTQAPIFQTLNKTDLDSWVPETILPDHNWAPDTFYPKLLKIETYCRLGFGAMDTPATVNKLPTQLPNFATDLRNFLDTVNSQTPACHEERENNQHTGWTYYLRAGMNARRGIIISASNIHNSITELYAHTEIDIHTIHTKPPEWQPGCHLFQLSTGRYSPARSLLNCTKEQNYKPIGLKPRGRQLLQIIITEARNGKQTLVVGPKDFTAQGNLTHIPEIAQLLAMPNVHIINHHHAEGVNRYDHCENAFIFHYEPRPDDIEKIVSRIYRDHTASFTRKKTTLKKAGLILQEVYRYQDPRVQDIYDKACEKRLMQSITRLRQMIHKNRRTYLFTSEPVSGLPVNPILFTIEDIQTCQAKHSHLDTFETFLKNKTAQNIKQIAEQDGISQRTAYRRTAQQRADAKAHLTNRIQELINSGVPQRKIAKTLNISLGKLQSTLKSAKPK